MSDKDIYKECATTSTATLEEYITNPCIPKNENEWWASREITRLRAENDKLRTEVMSDYHEGWEEGVKAERERCAKIAEQVRDDTCDGPVAWSMADGIASAIRESGE